MDTLLTVGLIGALMAAVTAMHMYLTTPPPEPVLVRPMDDLDVEFFRIIDREWLRELWPTP
jgi:hypothetical protein